MSQSGRCLELVRLDHHLLEKTDALPRIGQEDAARPAARLLRDEVTHPAGQQAGVRLADLVEEDESVPGVHPAVDVGDDLSLKGERSRPAVLDVQALEFLDYGFTWQAGIDVARLAVGGGEALRTAEKSLHFEAQSLHRPAQFVALAIVAAESHGFDVANTHSFEIGRYRAGGSGLAAQADDLVAVFAGLQRLFVQCGIAVVVGVQKEVAHHANAQLREGLQDRLQAGFIKHLCASSAESGPRLENVKQRRKERVSALRNRRNQPEV